MPERVVFAQDYDVRGEPTSSPWSAMWRLEVVRERHRYLFQVWSLRKVQDDIEMDVDGTVYTTQRLVLRRDRLVAGGRSWIFMLAARLGRQAVRREVASHLW